MQIVADGVDGVEQAQRAWDVARVLYQQATEQVVGAQRAMLAAVAEQANSLGGYAFYVGPVPEPAPVVKRPVGCRWLPQSILSFGQRRCRCGISFYFCSLVSGWTLCSSLRCARPSAPSGACSVPECRFYSAIE
jgi:hypothetical protein